MVSFRLGKTTAFEMWDIWQCGSFVSKRWFRSGARNWRRRRHPTKSTGLSRSNSTRNILSGNQGTVLFFSLFYNHFWNTTLPVSKNRWNVIVSTFRIPFISIAVCSLRRITASTKSWSSFNSSTSTRTATCGPVEVRNRIHWGFVISNTVNPNL